MNRIKKKLHVCFVCSFVYIHIFSSLVKPDPRCTRHSGQASIFGYFVFSTASITGHP